MSWTAEEIERMEPAIREEIQSRVVYLDGKHRDWVAAGRRECRRTGRGNGWQREWIERDPLTAAFDATRLARIRSDPT